MRLTPRSRRGRHSEEEENLSDVAAWLYTDLLLGLVVVFIGGGAFLQRYTAPSEKGTESAEVQQPLTHQLSCNEIEITLSQKSSTRAVADATTKAIFENSELRGWTDAKPGLVQIFGGDPDISQGGRDAEQFLRTAVSRVPSLKNAKILTAGDKSLRSDQVKIRIFVVYKGQIKDNGCKNN